MSPLPAPSAPLLEREKRPRRPENSRSGQPGGESREDKHGEKPRVSWLSGNIINAFAIGSGKACLSIIYADMFEGQNDGLAFLAENDSVIPNDKIRGIETRL